MKLFMANTTKHIQQFGYRIPEFNRLFEQQIKPGEQVLIYQDAPKEVLETILSQHTDTPKPFCIDVASAANVKGFVGLIYSFEKPVPADRIEETFEKNDEALEAQGLEQRKESAAALGQSVESKAEELGAGVSSLEVSVSEITKQGDQKDGKELNETIQVQSAKQAAKSQGKGK